MPLLTRPSASAVDAVSPAHLALGRVGAGASMLVRPKALPQLLGVDSATSTRVGWVVQMLGVRDLALGVGTLISLRGGERAATRTWLTMGVLCDAVDGLAVGGAMLKGRVSKAGGAAVVAVAAAAVAVGAAALKEDEAEG